MHVHGVVGAAGVGTTTTAVNLAAALRRAGHHAAALDLTGDVTALFAVAADGSLAAALSGGASVRNATVDAAFPSEVTDDLEAYYASLGREEPAFRAGADELEPAPGEPSPGELPVIVGGDREAFGEADEAALSDVRADLAFAYEHVIADARTLGPAVATMVDDVVAVTDTREESIATAQRGIAACADGETTVLGSVVNRAGERTDVTTLSDRLGTDVLAVVPADERTPAVEPVAYTAPDAPAAAAYDRLARKVAAWDGTPGLVDGGPDVAVVADGDGDGNGDDGDDRDDGTGRGLLGRLGLR